MKFSEFWKFRQIFKMCSYQNFLRKIFRNISSQQHQNILSEKILRFSEKIGLFKINRFLSENLSGLRFLLIGLSQVLTSSSHFLIFLLKLPLTCFLSRVSHWLSWNSPTKMENFSYMVWGRLREMDHFHGNTFQKM